MNRKFNIMASVMILILAAVTGACVYMIHDINMKREKDIALMNELNAEKERITSSEIARLKKSEHEALTAKSKAENEADSLRAEKENAEDTVRRYKNQLDALRKENEKLKAEVTRLTNKLNNSLVRIANPFKK
ncbi:MAG: hypothetical protein IJG34_00015 [Synergistaceae bacterium]|nr:hypothetical protein [Synergistaceae bacterium]MBQ3448274.1 hypothetical protein [Synergistaceae bacterium]MBQ3694941.1 hypothetical protein [Synergistaceae bacterium]MBQ6110813.1 hypothetical protein [Synergistaceae bacterium]MBQ9629371.1 hypothetical protein [Synergistaceae bacterium]